MNKREFQYFMEEQKLKVIENCAFGTVRDYPILIKRKNNRRLTVYVYLEGEPWKEIREEMLEIAKLFKSNVYCQNSYIVWNTTVGKREYTRFEEMISAIVRALEHKKIPTPSRCVICGEDTADAYAVIEEGNQPVHKECLQEQLQVTREYKDSGSYLLGILGGFLGGLVGSLPALLSLLLLGRSYCVLFLCIPPGIYYGCKFLRGKMNGLVFGLSIMLSFISVYGMQMALLIQYNLEAQFLPANWYYISRVGKKLLEIDGIWWNLTKESLLNLLFVMIGILINWELISQTSLKAEHDVLQVIDTINYRSEE